MIGKKIRLIREKSGLGTIKIAAPKLGVSHSTLGFYETGKSLPDVDFLAKFADATGADFYELLRLRLASGKTEEARALANTYQDVIENKDKYEAAQREIVQNDYIRGNFLGDNAAAKRSLDRLKSAGEQMRTISHDLKAIEADLGCNLPEHIRQAVLTLMFRYNLANEDVALLLNAVTNDF
jgi:transcriptional regulator with XRE-family HTH domain